jgi:hypothetical protein
MTLDEPTQRKADTDSKNADRHQPGQLGPPSLRFRSITCRSPKIHEH